MTEDAQIAIQATFRDAGIANVANIRPPLAVSASASRLTTQDLFAEGPWLALIALAGIVILFCIIGVIVICFTWARYAFLCIYCSLVPLFKHSLSVCLGILHTWSMSVIESMSQNNSNTVNKYIILQYLPILIKRCFMHIKQYFPFFFQISAVHRKVPE